MRFSKSSIKLTLCAGATSKQAKSRSGQNRPIDPVKKNHFTDAKPLRQVLMISIKFLFKDFKNGRKGEVPASSIKGNQNIFNSFDSQDLPEGYQAANGFYQIFKPSTFVQWASCPPGTQPGQRNTRILIFTFFCNKGNSMSLG